MARFLYQAKDRAQQSVQGMVDADSREAALSHVLDLGLYPSDIRPVSLASRSTTRVLPVSSYFRSVARVQVVFFLRQLSDLIAAGVPVLRALSLSSRQTKDLYFKEIIRNMSEEVRDGGMLSDAMARYPRVFPQVYFNLVKAGESSGQLSEVLTRLAELSQRDLDNRNQVVGAFIYPSLIMAVGACTVFALVTWVVPKMTAIFEDMDQALPLPTLLLIGISDFFTKYWIFILLGIGILGVIVYRMTTSVAGRLGLSRVMLKVPVLGGLIQDVELGRFSRTMSTLLGNGVSMLIAIDVTSQIITNEVIRQEVSALTQLVSDGASLYGALKKSQVFPEAVVTMVAVGEESGQVHQALGRTADYFEGRAQRAVKVITTLVEPLLILALGLVVGFVVLAMIMPLLRMNMIAQ